MRLRFADNLSAAVQLSAGVAAILLGLIVIVGWQTGSPVLTQVRPGLPAMQYVNALAFVIAGVGLLSAGSGRDDLAGISGLLIGAIGLLSLAQDALGLDPRIDFLFGVTTYLASGAATPARMPSNAALCFALTGTGLFLRRAGGAGRTSMLTSFVGATTAALGLVAVLGYATELAMSYGWGRLTSMALHTALGFVFVGGGLAARGWRDSPTVSAARLPALVGVASLTVSVAVWHALAAHDRQRTFQLIRTQAAYVRAAIATPLESEARAVERMALRLGGASPAHAVWAEDAARHLHDFAGTYVLERIDFTSGTHWSVPHGFRPSPELSERRAQAVRAARDGGTTALSHAVRLQEGSHGFVMAAPIVRSRAAAGAVVAVVNFDRLIERALEGQEQVGYEIALFDGVRQVHGRDRPGAEAEAWITEVDLGVRNTSLRLRLWPTPTRLAQLEGRLPSLMLVGGLLLSAVLTSMTFFAGTSRRRERQLRGVAQELRASEQRYRKARDAALESDRLKSEFVANVSHELRTPMNGILGLTELLLETDLTPEQREHAATVRECGETLLVLLNDILDLSKVAAGRLEIQSVPFEPRRLVQQTADLFAERARRKGVDLVCLVHHDVPDTVVGDPGRVRQVLTNLLGNAVKFTDAGEIVVRVSNAGSSEAGLVLRVEVSDTGIGIAPEAGAQIFQPFVQADGSITRKYGGTGLGLVISKQLAELMGGQMGMTSEVGRGSTFWFTVLATPVAAQPAPSATRDGLAGLRLLVVDDSTAGRRRLREVLETWRMRVTEASSGEEALNLLHAAAERGEPVDAVLVNLRQPGTSVFDVANVVQQADIAPRPRLILMSGRGQPGDGRRAQNLGAAAYLTQPITQSDLFDCLATVFATLPGAPAVAEPVPLVTRYTIGKRQDPIKEPLLVVEDNVVNQKVMVGLLRKLGYRADVAGNGQEALQALQHTPYRLVLMDSQMPGMDGFATTAEIRRMEGGTRRTVIVCVTAHAMKGERERCLAAGMDDYISKPVSLERLSAVLDQWLAAGGEVGSAGHESGSPRENSADREPAVDMDVLAQLRALEADAPGLVAAVVAAFLTETPARLEGIQRAFARKEAAALERAAHGLKGSAAAIGANPLAWLCEQIECCAREGRLTDASPAVSAAARAFDTVRAVLERERLVESPGQLSTEQVPSAES